MTSGALKIGWILAMAVACLLAGRADAALVFQEEVLDRGTLIRVSGEFGFADALDSFEAIARLGRARLVTFDSPGGSPSKAMELGRLIRRYGLATVQLRSTECASACALAFMGGAQRLAMAGSIGVHRSSFSDTADLPVDEAVSSVQQLTAEIIAYMNEMGVDPSLLQLALQYGSDDIRYLSNSEMERYRVVTPSDDRLAEESPPTRPPSTAPAAQPVRSEEDRARAFLDASMQAWSSENGVAMDFVSSAYSDPVRFYGKARSRAAVVGEKRSFVLRWPTRRYAMRPNTVSVQCANGLCTMSGVVDWYAHSEERGKTSTGLAELQLVWDPSSGQIVSESGHVLKPR